MFVVNFGSVFVFFNTLLCLNKLKGNYTDNFKTLLIKVANNTRITLIVGMFPLFFRQRNLRSILMGLNKFQIEYILTGN